MSCSGASDLRLVAGTTFAFGLTWQQKAGGQLLPVDISGCTARFQMRDVASTGLLVEATSEKGNIEIPNGPNGQINVSINPDDTKALGAATVGSVAYELRVYFPSGDVYSLMSGFVAIIEGVIRD